MQESRPKKKRKTGEHFHVPFSSQDETTSPEESTCMHACMDDNFCSLQYFIASLIDLTRSWNNTVAFSALDRWIIYSLFLFFYFFLKLGFRRYSTVQSECNREFKITTLRWTVVGAILTPVIWIIIEYLTYCLSWFRGGEEYEAGMLEGKKGKRQGTNTAKELYVFSSH